MKITPILNTLLRIGHWISILGDFLVRISAQSADTDLVQRIMRDRDRHGQSQDSQTL